MRTQFIQTENREEAENEAPWATVIIEVDGGFMAFESIDDYRTWENQK